MTVQLDSLDTLVHEINAEEIRKQKQLEIKKLTEITAENIIRDRRKNRQESNLKHDRSRKSRSRAASSGSNDDGHESSDNSSDNAPLNEIFYKLRKRPQATASYRFNDYDDLINSAIRRDMNESKGLGNAGRGKDISTIIEADKEEKKMQKLEQGLSDEGEEKTKVEGEEPPQEEQGAESSGSDVIRSKKAMHRKKKNRKLNNLDDDSEEDDKVSDVDFKGMLKKINFNHF